jgi:hypothetical protein
MNHHGQEENANSLNFLVDKTRKALYDVEQGEVRGVRRTMPSSKNRASEATVFSSS